MKKIISKKTYVVAIALLAVVVTMFFVGCTPAKMDVNTPYEIDADFGQLAYEYMQIFAGEELKDRTMCTQGELNSANICIYSYANCPKSASIS